MRHQGLEDPALDGFVFGRRLDDQIAIGESRIVLTGGDPRHRRLDVTIGDLASARLSGKVVFDRRNRSGEREFLHIGQMNIQASKRADMRNAGAHLPGADNADPLNHCIHSCWWPRQASRPAPPASA